MPLMKEEWGEPEKAPADEGGGARFCGWCTDELNREPAEESNDWPLKALGIDWNEFRLFPWPEPGGGAPPDWKLGEGGRPCDEPNEPAPPLAASKAALYEEAGAKEGIDCDWKNGPLEKAPNEGGELIEDPYELLKGEPAWCIGGCWACCCCCDAPEPPPSEPNGNDGEMEKVEPPKVNEGIEEPELPMDDGPAAPPVAAENRLCSGWLAAANCSNGDWGCCCCCPCADCCCDCGGLKILCPNPPSSYVPSGGGH